MLGMVAQKTGLLHPLTTDPVALYIMVCQSAKYLMQTPRSHQMQPNAHHMPSNDHSQCSVSVMQSNEARKSALQQTVSRQVDQISGLEAEIAHLTSNVHYTAQVRQWAATVCSDRRDCCNFPASHVAGVFVLPTETDTLSLVLLVER